MAWHRMDYEAIATMVMETAADGADAEKLVKAAEVLCDCKITWSEKLDCYAVTEKEST